MWGAIGVFVLVGIFLQTHLYLSGIFLLYGIGTVVSVLLLQSEYGKRIEWVEKLCHLGTPPSEGQGCNAVTQSSSSKIFGFSWAEIGLVYFGGSALALSMAQLTLIQVSPLPLLHFITLPYIIYSLYYQAFVVRAWCMLCLIVQGVLIMIAVAWLGHYDWHLRDVSGINVVASLLTTASFALMVASWLFFKQVWQRERQLVPTKRALEQWQNDSDLFLSHLYAQPITELGGLPNETQIGNIDAPIVVTMVSNPHCNPCKEAYKELTGWVKYFEDEIQLRIRHINSSEVHYQEHEKWAKEVRIEYTPTLFINGYQLRSPYSYKDIWKHVRILAEVQNKTITI